MQDGKVPDISTLCKERGGAEGGIRPVNLDQSIGHGSSDSNSTTPAIAGNKASAVLPATQGAAITTATPDVETKAPASVEQLLLAPANTGPNPFTNTPSWRALGFSDPRATASRDTSRTRNTNGRPTHTPTAPRPRGVPPFSPAKTLNQHNHNPNEHKNPPTPPLLPSSHTAPTHPLPHPQATEHSIFHPDVSPKQREVYLLGFSRGSCCPHLRFGTFSGGQATRSRRGVGTQRGGRRGGRGRWRGCGGSGLDG